MCDLFIYFPLNGWILILHYVQTKTLEIQLFYQYHSLSWILLELQNKKTVERMWALKASKPRAHLELTE